MQAFVAHGIVQQVCAFSRRARHYGAFSGELFLSPTLGPKGMLDVKSQRCSVEGCENIPLDNCRGEVMKPACFLLYGAA